MNEGIHLDLDTWIVPGQIRRANLCRGLGNRYTPAGTEVLISAVAHNTPPPFQAAQNATPTHIYLHLTHRLGGLGVRVTAGCTHPVSPWSHLGGQLPAWVGCVYLWVNMNKAPIQVVLHDSSSPVCTSQVAGGAGHAAGLQASGNRACTATTASGTTTVGV